MQRQWALLAAVLLFPLACDSNPPQSMEPPPEPDTVVVTPATANIRIGNTQQFGAAALDRSGNPVVTAFIWTSSSQQVATVSVTGLATALTTGTTRIRATSANGIWSEALLTVTAEDSTAPPPPPVANVQVSPNFAALTPGTTQQFTAVARTASGAVVTAPLTWTSSAEHIATVSATGLATGVSAGSAQIRASAANGVFGEGTVSITAPPPPEFRVSRSENVSGLSRNPTASVQVPTGQKVIGCGALADFNPELPGLMLTAVYPSDARTCTATARDHLAASEGTVRVWAIAVIDPQNEWDVNIVSQTQAGNSAVATLPPGFALTGGGSRITSTGAGVFLTSSRPGGTAWITAGKDHIQTDQTGNTTSYAIGIRPRNGAAAPTSTVTFQQITGLETRIAAASGTTLVGGGATIAFNGPGRLLKGSYPDLDFWVAIGKEHLQPDVGTITAYAIGIRVP